ncbi:MAG: tRNA dihydrouridine synthase DusB [Calditrichaeota bacterium]|nr:MAG: tRNA dihydrouridine synthase DusB [Calditrichota bacterium]
MTGSHENRIGYRSQINRAVPLAESGEFGPLRLGPLHIWPPVVLAPMAGVTNAPFRRLCRRFGAGLFISEMVIARGIVEANPKTLELAAFAEDESPRSLQLYGTDPYYMGEAVARLVQENRVDHIDLNFGCPVRKVTGKGGGAAIPLRPNLLRNLVAAAVRNAGPVPVTIKFRVGIDDDTHTYLTAGRIAEEEGCAAVSLHARTAAQLYDGEADWGFIARLKESLSTIPVLGNGDVWEAFDALRMMRQTGCDGVVIGRGCLGRPWLFRDLVDVFEGREPQPPPNLGEVADIMLRHARLLSDWFGEGRAVRMFRKHCTWYMRDFKSAKHLRLKLVQTTTLRELELVLRELDRDEPFPRRGLRRPRGKKRGRQKVALPPGYLDDRKADTPPPPEAEIMVSGG